MFIVTDAKVLASWHDGKWIKQQLSVSTKKGWGEAGLVEQMKNDEKMQQSWSMDLGDSSCAWAVATQRRGKCRRNQVVRQQRETGGWWVQAWWTSLGPFLTLLSFLDLCPSWDKLDTDVCYKPTNSHSYLDHTSSCSLVIPYLSSVSVWHICSQDEVFYSSRSEISCSFRIYGFGLSTVDVATLFSNTIALPPVCSSIFPHST